MPRLWPSHHRAMERQGCEVGLPASLLPPPCFPRASTGMGSGAPRLVFTRISTQISSTCVLTWPLRWVQVQAPNNSPGPSDLQLLRLRHQVAGLPIFLVGTQALHKHSLPLESAY